MLALKKFLFKGGSAAHLPDDLRAALDAWREQPAPVLEEAHFHTRYIVLDISSSGLNPASDKLLSIAASAVQQATILPADAVFIDCAGLASDAAAVDRKLMAFLQYVAKAPIVTYHIPYVGGFLQRTFKERLGIDFQPQWVDLAWLLPSLFEEKERNVMPLDYWIETFGLDSGGGRRSAMENTLILARIFQMLLVRANGKDIDTAAQLIE